MKPFTFLLIGLIAFYPSTASLAASQKSDEEKAGAILFRDKGCTFCHGVGGVGTKKAPALSDLYKDKTWPPEKINNQILDGGQKMPPFRESVTDEDVTNLIAYLRAKKKPVPPAPTQDSVPASSPQ